MKWHFPLLYFKSTWWRGPHNKAMQVWFRCVLRYTTLEMGSSEAHHKESWERAIHFSNTLFLLLRSWQLSWAAFSQITPWNLKHLKAEYRHVSYDHRDTWNRWETTMLRVHVLVKKEKNFFIQMKDDWHRIIVESYLLLCNIYIVLPCVWNVLLSFSTSHLIIFLLSTTTL